MLFCKIPVNNAQYAYCIFHKQANELKLRSIFMVIECQGDPETPNMKLLNFVFFFHSRSTLARQIN